MTSTTLTPSAPSIPEPPAEDLADEGLSPLVVAGRRRRLLRHGADLTRFVAPALLLTAWQLGANAGRLDPLILPAPSRLIAGLRELHDAGLLLDSLVVSLRRAATGFAWGASLGLLLGLVSGLSRIGERAFDSFIQMLRTIPFIALIPLFVVWFGVGEEPKVILVGVACVFPVYVNTFVGVRNVDPKVVEAASVFGLGRIRRAVEVVLPLATPTILIGVRLAAGFSLLALVAAEQVNARSGLSYLALAPRAATRTDLVLGVVLIFATLGLLVDAVVRLIQHLALPWHRATLVRTAR